MLSKKSTKIQPRCDGVWISRDTWRILRRNLDIKVREVEKLYDDQTTLQCRYEGELRELRADRLHLQDACARTESELAAKMAQQEELIARLQHELQEKQHGWDREQRSLRTQLDSMVARAGERDRMVEGLSKDLQECERQKAAETQRSAAAEDRLVCLQHEADVLRGQVRADEQRVMDLEAHARVATQNLREAKSSCANYREQLVARRDPSEELLIRNNCLLQDNRRLLALLEDTAEYRRFSADADLSSTSYLSLADCCFKDHILSEVPAVYSPLKDRAVAWKAEDEQWVPRVAISTTLSFLMRHFPGLDQKPFMSLIHALNKIWKAHTMERLSKQKLSHQKELLALKRHVRTASPYTEVLLKDKVSHLKRQLRCSARRAEKASKDAGEKAAQQHEENKTMLWWGLSTIDKLSRQADALDLENQHLKSHLLHQAVDVPLPAAEGAAAAALAQGVPSAGATLASDAAADIGLQLPRPSSPDAWKARLKGRLSGMDDMAGGDHHLVAGDADLISAPAPAGFPGLGDAAHNHAHHRPCSPDTPPATIRFRRSDRPASALA